MHNLKFTKENADAKKENADAKKELSNVMFTLNEVGCVFSFFSQVSDAFACKDIGCGLDADGAIGFKIICEQIAKKSFDAYGDAEIWLDKL